MAYLKLSKLPDRTPVKITITIVPDLNRALQTYAELYRETYGETEPVAELIPHMLASFLEADRGFAKARKQVPDTAVAQIAPRRQRRGTAAVSSEGGSKEA
jgi:hypothetical protein